MNLLRNLASLAALVVDEVLLRLTGRAVDVAAAAPVIPLHRPEPVDAEEAPCG